MLLNNKTRPGFPKTKQDFLFEINNIWTEITILKLILNI